MAKTCRKQSWCSGECTLLTINVAPVQIPASTPYEGWVCCWLSPHALRGFSLGTLISVPAQKPTFPNSNSNRNWVDKEPLSGCATSKLLFIYLFIYLFIIYMTLIEWVQSCQWLSTTVSLCPAYPIKEIGTLQLVQCTILILYIILQFHNV